MRHTIQAIVENKFGVLSRVASLFSARGYNITSLAVGETQDPSTSCMTMVVEAEDESDAYKEKFELALVPLKTYLEHNQEDGKVWNLLGKVYANLGLDAESKDAFEKADLYQ